MAQLKKLQAKRRLDKLVDSINQVNADAEGITLKEYYKKQAVRKKASSIYAKTHWVQTLTDAKKYLIATPTDEQKNNKDLPIS